MMNAFPENRRLITDKNNMIIEYLGLYERELKHQREHGSAAGLVFLEGQPSENCFDCLTTAARNGDSMAKRHDVKLRYAWAIPNEQALKTIGTQSPNGVVEIGAGGGYRAMLLRERGVDVIAYDPDPAGTGGDGVQAWHDGHRWSEVLHGDHTAVIGHPDRTLLLCWPSYDMTWTHEVIELYAGDTIVYIGEGNGGCTGDDRMHALLGSQPYCYHPDGERCECNWPAAQFEEIETVGIPQWGGLHDYLAVFKRREPPKTDHS